MKLSKKVFIYVIMLFMPYVGVTQIRATAFSLTTNQHSKEESDSLYSVGKYNEAISLYQKIIEQQGTSSEIYYNLGNCYYKIHDLAHSILYYERALKIDPSDEDIRYNLSLARKKIQDKNVMNTDIFLSAWWKSTANLLSLNLLKILALINFVLCLLLIILLQVHYFDSYKKTLKILLFCCLGFSILFNIFAFQQYRNIVNSQGCIVMSKAIEVKSSPTDISTSLFLIHEGTRLEIIDYSMKEWCQIKYDEEKQGWIKKTQIEII